MPKREKTERLRQREISLRARGPPRPASDKLERAPSGALSPEIERDKGDDTPLSLNETRNSSKDKSVPSQPEDLNSLKVITMHSDSESTVISPRADQFGSTLPPLDKRAQDKNEGGEEGTIPPHSSKKALKIIME